MTTPSNNANVIPLHGDKSTHARSELAMKESLARLPRPVQRVREVAQSHLKGCVQNLFDHVDDALFELADKASSNLEQNVFFESMREIRIKRRAMEKSFLQHVDGNFACLIGGYQNAALQASDNAPQTLDDLDTDDLSLVSKDELEELVAIDSLVSKAWAQNRNALRVVAARVNALVTVAVSEKNNPFTPRSLADSFTAASSLINVDIKAKLVLFKLFERYVMNDLAAVLNEVNQALTELGVPIPKSPARRSSQARQKANVHQSKPAPTEQAAGGLYETLQSLLDNRATDQGPSSFSDTSYANHPSESYGVTEVSYDLLTALSRLQQEQIQHVPVQAQLEAGESPLMTPVNIQDALKTPSGDSLVDDRSQNVMKLVDMLFAYILEDENLPDPIKLMLSRLQIPFIKVAIADDEFFKKESHPARRLLNEMATSSIGWTGNLANGKPDPLLKKVEDTVTTVLKEFDSNFEIFTLLLTDFIAFQEKERRRAMLFEKRAIDAEDGKAKAEVGRQTVDAKLTDVVAGKVIPEIFTSFIQGPWSNILFLIYMRQGPESKQWINALNVAKELVWSAMPIQNDKHAEKLTRLLPKLQVALKKGLESISFNPVKQATFFKKIESHQTALFADYRNQNNPKTNQQVTEAAPQYQQQAGAISSKEAEALQPQVTESTAKINVADMVEEALNAASEQAQSAVAPIDELSHVEQVSLDEVVEPRITAETPNVPEAKNIENEQPQAQTSSENNTAQANSEQTSLVQSEEPKQNNKGKQVKEQPAKEQAMADSQYLNLVDNFTVGVWFEKQDDSNAAYRCRLAAIIRGTGKYIFVNRSGVKVAEETRETLAIHLQSGDMKTLDDGMLFDRALESVISTLRAPS
jgi:hypothetical protein